MRITIINQFYAPDISPTAHLAASLAEGLAEHGHQMTIIASRGGYVEASQVEQSAGDNPRVHRIWTPRLGKKTIIKRCIDYASFYLGAAYRMTRLAPQDVIISLTTPPYIAWTSILHRSLHPRTKLVLWNMDCYPEATERAGIFKTGGLISRSMRWLNRQLFRRLDHLICLDHAIVRLRRRSFPIGKNRLTSPLPPPIFLRGRRWNNHHWPGNSSCCISEMPDLAIGLTRSSRPPGDCAIAMWFSCSSAAAKPGMD
jgi:hypothetical protein